MTAPVALYVAMAFGLAAAAMFVLVGAAYDAGRRNVLRRIRARRRKRRERNRT